MVYSVTVTQLIEKMDLKNHTPEIDTDKILIQDPGIPSPGRTISHYSCRMINRDCAYIALHIRLGTISMGSVWIRRKTSGEIMLFLYFHWGAL